MQSRIFEPFVQGEVGLNRRHSGTGLGLSICSKLASLMKGNISLQSTVGVGSTFTVRIPLRQVLATLTTRASHEAGQSTSRTLSLTKSSEQAKTDSEKGADSTSAPTENNFAKCDMAFVPASNSEKGTQSTFAPAENSIAERDMALAPASNEQPEEKTRDALPVTQPAVAAPVEQPAPAPRAPSKPRKKPKKEAADDQRDFSKLRVLIAEDNKINQQVILRMLKMEKVVDTTVAEDGQEALELVKTLTDHELPDPYPYDLTFMDVQMPNMDGLEPTRKLREFKYPKPIIALTAFAEKTYMDDCYSAGA
ncbi:Histidine kinase osmosensor [Saxophila tyrrhenica]|uniref:Histidine kinase osmosensor n=1 Tax=Saxophila tyrrhenica TaxID=1690608 RepID=A0AAV9PBK8_9PEZI|nr:Histidine kinase osmosensor [Saxophila tyrrhenica]